MKLALSEGRKGLQGRFNQVRSSRGNSAVVYVLVLAFLSAQVVLTAGPASAATTTVTHTRIRVTTTATLIETTTATSNTLGSRAFIGLLVLLIAAASAAVVAGYAWGKKRTRKNLLGSS